MVSSLVVEMVSNYEITNAIVNCALCKGDKMRILIKKCVEMNKRTPKYKK